MVDKDHPTLTSFTRTILSYMLAKDHLVTWTIWSYNMTAKDHRSGRTYLPSYALLHMVANDSLVICHSVHHEFPSMGSLHM